jgi:gliding motility associated protien GldN
MKKSFIIVVLCLACVASFAQTKKKAPAKKPTTTKKPTAAPQVGSAASQQTSMVDTTKKIVDAPITADPAKPFERPLDGYYKKTAILSARPTPYANIRESDAQFQKRVWREIDVREKRNLFLASPKGRLIDALMDAIAAGELTAYDPLPTKDDPNGDAFGTPLTAAKAKAKLADSSLVNIIDANGEKTGSKMVAGDFQPDSIVKFRIKEDWIFDKQRSVFEPRIIGIAPLFRQKVGDDITLDYQPAFWIYFPEARHVLATKEAFNRNNDATSLSLDDIFLKRLFSSYIVKESNDQDLRIKDYATGIDKLYESERIKKQLMEYELNLWEY